MCIIYYYLDRLRAAGSQVLAYEAFRTGDIQTITRWTVRFIKPKRNPVNKCTGPRQGFMKWALQGYSLMYTEWYCIIY